MDMLKRTIIGDDVSTDLTSHDAPVSKTRYNAFGLMVAMKIAGAIVLLYILYSANGANERRTTPPVAHSNQQ